MGQSSTMDPLTQGLWSASFGQAGLAKRPSHPVAITSLAALAGMAPDLDVLIRSSSDPLLALEFHRQFSHALVFIPVGALLCFVAFYFLGASKWLSKKETLLCALLGFAGHGVLDAATSYGTQLFWPFSHQRVSGHLISIIDPLFSFPLLFFLIMGIKKKAALWRRMALLYGIFYLTLGFVQRERAEMKAEQLAASRGHRYTQLFAKPSFGNLIVWKSIYEAQGRYYVDAIRVALRPTVYPGESIARLDLTRDFAGLNLSPRQRQDIERFRWFSQGFVAPAPARKNFIIDVRYSLVPNSIDPLWGIRLFPERPQQHVSFEQTRGDPKAAWFKLWAMIKGERP